MSLKMDSDSSQSNPNPQPLRFIQEGVIRRLNDGSFVPNRRTHPGAYTLKEGGKDRRDTVSPLAVTKRCVRYESRVFENRRDLLLLMADTLNRSDKKLLMIAGGQGSGKTSLSRGIIELMGGGSEQVLWFDVNLHTDFDEIIRFLIQYMTYICSALGIDNTGTHTAANPEDPFARLQALIQRASHVPLLVVIDNVEHIVGSDYQIHSYPLKEMLNFLLAFPNIKMMLLGERLPYGDMSSASAVIENIKLEGLSEASVLEMLTGAESVAGESQEARLFLDLFRKTRRTPSLLKVLLYLYRHSLDPLQSLTRLNERVDAAMAAAEQTSPEEIVIRFVYENLSRAEQLVAQVMAFVRHPADLDTLVAMAGFCMPELSGELSLKGRELLKKTLEESFLKTLMKRTFPPQEVLSKIAVLSKVRSQTGRPDKHELAAAFRPSYELYRQIKKIIYNSIPEIERSRVHERFQEFYLKEKAKTREDRVYAVGQKALLSEAKHHGNASRRRRENVMEDGPLTTKAWASSENVLADRATAGETSLQQQTSVQASGIIEPTPVTLDSVEITSADISLPEPLTGVNLSDEEKKFLFGIEDSGNVLHSDDRRAGPPAKDLKKPERRQDLQAIFAEVQEPYLTEEDIEAFGDRSSQAMTSASSGLPVSDSLPVSDASAGESEAGSESPASQDFGETSGAESPGNIYYDPVEKQIQEQLAAAVSSRNKASMLHLLVELGRYRLSKTLYAEAEKCFRKALELKIEKKPEMLADIYSQLGNLYKETYRHNEAMNYLLLALKQFEILEPSYESDSAIPSKSPLRKSQLETLAKVHKNLGDIDSFRKRYKDAIQHFYKALAVYAQADDDIRQAEIYFNLGAIYDEMGLRDNSLNYYAQALAIDKRHGHHVSCAATLSNMGSLHLEAGEFDEALNCFEEGLVYDKQAENTDGMFKTLSLLGLVNLKLEKFLEAEGYYKSALAIALHEGVRSWKGLAYLKLGNLYQYQEKWEEALGYFEAAKEAAYRDLSRESQTLLETKIQEAKDVLQQRTRSGGAF